MLTQADENNGIDYAEPGFTYIRDTFAAKKGNSSLRIFWNNSSCIRRLWLKHRNVNYFCETLRIPTPAKIEYRFNSRSVVDTACYGNSRIADNSLNQSIHLRFNLELIRKGTWVIIFIRLKLVFIRSHRWKLGLLLRKNPVQLVRPRLLLIGIIFIKPVFNFRLKKHLPSITFAKTLSKQMNNKGNFHESSFAWKLFINL